MVASPKGGEADRILVPVGSVGKNVVKGVVPPSGYAYNLFEFTGLG